MTQHSGSERPGAARRWVFAAICILATLVVGTAVTRALLTGRDRAKWPAGLPASTLAAAPPRPFVMFRSLIAGPTWNRVAIVSLSEPDGGRYMTDLTCETVYFAGTRGVCLGTEETPFPKYYASIFDESFRALHKIALTGVPSRVRVSPDGRRAAVTVFEHGHSYAETGFSTRTTLFDTSAGRSLGTLEEFTVTRDGKVFRSVDFNFWGVTFARDGRRFFATLSSGGAPFLIEGDVDRREARVVRAGIECPSLSPDNSQIVFKKRVPQDRGWEWRLWLLDLSTMAERALAEPRNINDQVDWLDNTHILYQDSSAEGTDIWVLNTNANDAPRRFVRSAFSPAVVR